MDQNELLESFRSLYGRLCSLTAQALWQADDGHALIYEAFNGGGGILRADLQTIRQAHVESNVALNVCRAAGIEWPPILGACYVIREAIEDEWDVSLKAHMAA